MGNFQLYGWRKIERLKWLTIEMKMRTFPQFYRNTKDYFFKKKLLWIFVYQWTRYLRWMRQIQRSVKSPKSREFRASKKCEWITKNLQIINERPTDTPGDFYQTLKSKITFIISKHFEKSSLFILWSQCRSETTPDKARITYKPID